MEPSQPTLEACSRSATSYYEPASLEEGPLDKWLPHMSAKSRVLSAKALCRALETEKCARALVQCLLSCAADQGAQLQAIGASPDYKAIRSTDRLRIKLFDCNPVVCKLLNEIARCILQDVNRKRNGQALEPLFNNMAKITNETSFYPLDTPSGLSGQRNSI